MANIVIITDEAGASVIVIDPELQAELFYTPSAGPGNLLMSLAAKAGTDKYGNSFPQGLRVNIPPLNMPAMENGWAINGHARYLLDPVGNLQVSWKDLIPGTDADGTEIWAPGSLPAGFQPHDNRRVPCYTDALRIPTGPNPNPEGPALEIEPDGSVQCYGIASVATRVDLFATIPLTF